MAALINSSAKPHGIQNLHMQLGSDDALKVGLRSGQIGIMFANVQWWLLIMSHT